VVKEKVNCFYFLCFSFFIDLIWIIFWAGKFDQIIGIEKTAYILVVFFSFLGVLIKLIVITAIGLNEWDTIKGYLPKKLLEKLNVQQQMQEEI